MKKLVKKTDLTQENSDEETTGGDKSDTQEISDADTGVVTVKRQ